MTPMTPALDKQAFIASMIRQEVLRFGDFKLKSGRRSPYFFNLGNVSGGAELAELGRFYADAIEASGVAFEVLFGPAYKGIPIAVATAVAFAERGRGVGVAYNRKEAKAHGEGGVLVGAPLRGRVLMIDDVVTEGAAKYEAAALIRDAGATLVGVAIALDRQEVLAEGETAAARLAAGLGAPVISIANLADLIAHLEQANAEAAEGASRDQLAAMIQHQQALCAPG